MSSTTTTTLQAGIEGRRSIYALQKASTISDERIRELAADALKHAPSSFNSQSTRLVVLLKEEHEKFWDIVSEILKAHVPADKWDYTNNRLTGFRGGYGTILFYEDPEPIKALQTKFPNYANNFPTWSEHTSAIHQYVLWQTLEAEGLGANLQHYNPLPNARAAATWNIPEEWDLKAQLVFGTPAPDAREKLQAKATEPLEKRLFVHGA